MFLNLQVMQQPGFATDLASAAALTPRRQSRKIARALP